VGRKSLKTQKVSNILDAFEACIKRQGLQGTTLDDIAKEAQMARRMVRHYTGNKEQLVALGVARIIEKFNQSAFSIIDQHNTKNRLETGLDYLFSEAFNTHDATQSIAALLPVSFHDEQVKAALKTIYDTLQYNIDSEIAIAKPNADPKIRQRTSYNIMCLAFGGGWMLNLGFNPSLNQQNKLVAQQLIAQM